MVCLVILVLVAGFIEALRGDVKKGKDSAVMVMSEVGS